MSRVCKCGGVIRRPGEAFWDTQPSCACQSPSEVQYTTTIKTRSITPMKDKELEEQMIEIVLKPALWQFDDYLEAKKQLKLLIEQERGKAKIEVLEWVYSNLPKRGNRFSNAKKIDLQEIIMGLDIDIAWEIAELKEDKGGNKGE